MAISQLKSGERTVKRELDKLQNAQEWDGEKMAMVLNWGAKTVQDWQDEAICKENVHIYLLG